MGSSYIHYAESSMKNGFGLKYLHRFFNIPFLQLQVIFYSSFVITSIIMNVYILKDSCMNNNSSNCYTLYEKACGLISTPGQSFIFCVCVRAERDPPKAAGDQPVGHGRHPGGAVCATGDRRSKL